MATQVCSTGPMVDIPDSLADDVQEIWEQVDGMTLAEVYDRFTEGLVTGASMWKNYEQLDAEASTGLDDLRVLRLALLASGELPTSDRVVWNRPHTQPWFQAYVLLYDLLLDNACFVALSPALAWLAIDALLVGLPCDGRHNPEQAAAGWISTALNHRTGDDPRLAEQRMLALVEDSFGADGYDTGSMDDDLRLIADRIGDPHRAAELRLMHAYLSYATAPWEEFRRTQLVAALSEVPPGVDPAKVREECAGLMGSWSGDPLPCSADEVVAGD